MQSISRFHRKHAVAILRFSVGDLFIVEALFDYTPKPNEKTLLPLTAGERVTVVELAGDEQGWWKAVSGFKVGFIPKDYVQKISNGKTTAGNGSEVDAASESSKVTSEDTVTEVLSI